MEKQKLPSLFQIDDVVSVNFPGTGSLSPCKVIKVAFTGYGDPLYDVEVPFKYYEDQDGLDPDTPRTSFARIHGLKEWHLRIPLEPIADVVPDPRKTS